jgi:O-Antigen ligase
MALACGLGLTIAIERWLFVAGALGLLLLTVWPMEAALGAYALLIPFESLTTLAPSPGPQATLLRYLGLLAIFVIFGVGWLRGRIVRPPKAALYSGLLILWCAATSIWAIDSNLAIRRLPTALGLWLVYFAIVSVRVTQQELSRIRLMIILGAACAAAYANAAFLLGEGVVGRVSIGGGVDEADPNFFAATLLLPLSLAFGDVLSSRTWSLRGLYLALTGMIVLTVFLTMSRGALLGVLTTTLVFLVRVRLNWRVFLPVAVLCAALLWVPQMFFQRLEEAPGSRGAGRLDIWIAGAHSLASYGLIGAGLENFPNAYTEYAGHARFYQGGHRAAHNIYLATSVELGFFGLILLVIFLALHLREFKSRGALTLSSQVIAFEAACWAMLVAGSSLDLLWSKSFWLVWALPASALHAIREDKQQSLSTSHEFGTGI